ncbi:hypothetical protein B0J17DRAFT_299058 [Rhizoctonia solani]|nr:hypothetical protein B0J17DRAFT_299058 [Rhizoctonia solani]
MKICCECCYVWRYIVYSAVFWHSLRTNQTNLDVWAQYIDRLQDFVMVLKPLMKAPGAQHGLIRSEWDKVYLLLAQRLDSFIRCPTPKYILKEAKRAWDVLLTRQMTKASGVYICSNPRCANPSVTISQPEVNVTCGGCGNAHYCSQMCQRVHWKPSLLNLTRWGAGNLLKVWFEELVGSNGYRICGNKTYIYGEEFNS